MPDIRRNEHTNMPAYNDGEMDEEKDEEKDGEKDALAELAHTEQRGQKREDGKREKGRGKREKGRGKREQGRGKRGIAGIPARTGHTGNGKQKIPHSTKKRKQFLLPLFCL